MSVTVPLLRRMPKAASVLLLWLLPVAFSAEIPVHPSTAAGCCPATTGTLKKLVRHVRTAGSPAATRRHFFEIRRHPSRSWIRHDHARPTHAADDQAIQNDDAALDASVEFDIELQRLGAFDDPFQARISTRAFSPRAPRGPPCPA